VTSILCLHPIHKKLTIATPMPDYFGEGKDGFKFSDGKVYPIDKVQQFNDTPAPVLSPELIKLGTTG
jgi:hypothetical protein